MRLFFIICVVSFLALPTHAQDNTELEKRKGFKDIKLTTNVNEYPLKYVKDIEDEKFKEAKLYERKKGTYPSIGEIRIRDLKVKAYDYLIYEITVTVDKDPKLYKALKKVYGKPDFSIVEKAYFWKTKNLVLYFKSVGKNEIQLRYYSYEIIEKQKQDKEEDIEALTDEF